MNFILVFFSILIVTSVSLVNVNGERFQSPKEQIDSGILPIDVKCKENLHLIVKMSDDSPACVKQSSIEKLVARGWGFTENLIKLSNTNDVLKYEIKNGKIFSISAYSTHTNSFQPGETLVTMLVIMLDAKENNTLSITLPRNLIDSKKYDSDEHFLVLINKTDTRYEETTNTFERILSLNTLHGTNKIEIFGYGYYNPRLSNPPP